MSDLRRVLFVSVILLVSYSVAAEDDGERSPLPLPKVPARSAIVKPGGDDQKLIGEWVQKLIEGKEKRAQSELETYKKQFIAEERKRQMESRERQRRQERFDVGGAPATEVRETANAPIHIKMEFQVPEILTYRAVSDVLRARQALANEIVDTLAKLDKDADGKLSLEEYKDAGALLAGTLRMFQPIDSNGDGAITEAEIESAREMPATVAAALKAGKAAVAAQNFRIKPYDADGNGVLDVDERKALVMAYVDASLHAAQDAAFYRRVAEALVTSRETAAAKFEDIEIAP